MAWLEKYKDTKVMKTQKRHTWQAMGGALRCIVDTGFPAEEIEEDFGYRPTPTPEEDDGPEEDDAPEEDEGPEVSHPAATSAH